MATAFDSIGMGQLGSEKRFMTQSNPFSEGLKAIKDFAMLSAIDKSGLAEYLNKVGQQNEDLKDKYKTPAPVGAAVPNQPYAIKPIMAVDPNAMVAPYMGQTNLNQPTFQTNSPFGGGVFNNSIQQQQKSIEDAADEAMGLTKSTSFITPSPTVGSNEQVAESVLSRASQPVTPPNMMNLPQYGKKQDSGVNPLSILSTIATLLV